MSYTIKLKVIRPSSQPLIKVKRQRHYSDQECKWSGKDKTMVTYMTRGSSTGFFFLNIRKMTKITFVS